MPCSHYELGVVRTPDFGQAWGVALSPKGLAHDSCCAMPFTPGRCALHDCRIENAVAERFPIRYEPFTDIETPIMC